MKLRYELKNYRCFPDSEHAAVTIAPGFTSFVGVNNSGKSTLLRSLYELRLFLGSLASADSGYLSNPGSFELPLRGVSDPGEVFNDTNRRPMVITFERLDEPESLSDGAPVPEVISFTVDRDTRLTRVDLRVEGVRVRPMNWRTRAGATSVLALSTGGICDPSPFRDVFADLANSLYLGAFRNSLNVGAGDPYFDLAVGQSFIAQWDQFESSIGNKRNRAAALDVQRQLGAIFGLDAVELNASSDNQTLLISIGNQTYRLDELGSGFAQFVIVLAYVATRNPRLILIDEPELNLHPSLQIDFLNTLTSLAGFGVWFATHSIGLARAASDRVYSLHRLDQGRSQVRPLESTVRMSEFLGELNLSGYQELGYSTVLLVEGPSELRALQRLLRMYRIEHKVVLVPLGGGDLIKAGVEPELEELKRLTPSLYALIDSERSTEGAKLDPQRAGFVSACEAAGVKCHVLERRAIENYFSDRAIKAVLGGEFSALAPYERVKDVSKPWSKTNDNWRIAGELTEDEIADTDLGAFLRKMAMVVAPDETASPAT